MQVITEITFGGIQENSMIDFPGKLACVLFVSGCNFRCPYCHNSDLVMNNLAPSCEISLMEVAGFLKERKGFLEGVVITGGEPTLQPGLLDACKIINDLGYPVKLDTNGSHPKLLESLITRGVVDYIAMDIKTDPDRYAPLIVSKGNPSSIMDSIWLILESGIAHEFRTTCMNPLVDESIIEKIAGLIKGADLYVLQQFHANRVLDPDFCRQNGRRYDDGTLEKFRSIVAPHVKQCLIR